MGRPSRSARRAPSSSSGVRCSARPRSAAFLAEARSCPSQSCGPRPRRRTSASGETSATTGCLPTRVDGELDGPEGRLVDLDLYALLQLGDERVLLRAELVLRQLHPDAALRFLEAALVRCDFLREPDEVPAPS